MSVDREFKTRRGALLAQMEHKRQPDGTYLVEGYTVGADDGAWIVFEGNHRFKTFTDALEWIGEEVGGEFRLDPDQVTDTYAACMSSTTSAGSALPLGPDEIEVDAIAFIARFDRTRLQDHAELITAMLLELPEQFRESAGGGWSFLQACDDRHGRQWTGLHRTMAMLFAMGEALGLVKCLLPRDMWDALPGGVPYYVILDRSTQLTTRDGASSVTNHTMETHIQPVKQE